MSAESSVLLCLRTALRERVAVDEAASTQVGREGCCCDEMVMTVMVM